MRGTPCSHQASRSAQIDHVFRHFLRPKKINDGSHILRTKVRFWQFRNPLYARSKIVDLSGPYELVGVDMLGSRVNNRQFVSGKEPGSPD